LKLNHDKLLSNFAFYCNPRPYTVAAAADEHAVQVSALREEMSLELEQSLAHAEDAKAWIGSPHILL